MTETRDRLAHALAERYLLEEALGCGATATGYLAQDLRHGRRVALSVLHAALGQALGVERLGPIHSDISGADLHADGRPRRAVATLHPLLTLPSWITPAELMSDPLWAAIRAQPGFADLTSATP